MNKTVFIILVVILSVRSAHSANLENDSLITDSISYAPFMTITNIDTLLNKAKKLTGIKYSYGGTSTRGFDCSGFLKYVMEHLNIPFPRTAAEQFCLGESISTETEAQVGDLIFFKPRNRSHRVGHVGLISKIEDGEIYMIHASSSAGIKEINYTKSVYFTSRLMGIKRWWF